MQTTTGYVEVDGGRLYLESAGAGADLVFLHPGLWDLRTWDGQFDRFAEAYRVVRYDARGYGRSSRLEPGRPYSPVADLAAVLDAVSADHAALIGCSMGGATAVDFVLTYPERVDALVLAASGMNGLDDTTPEEEAELDRLYEGIDEAMEVGDLEGAQDIRLRLWAPLGTGDDAGRRVRQIAFDNIHELTMDESGARNIEPPAIERLEEISAPTLVLPADHDPMTLRRVSSILAQRIPGARLVQIPETDHVLNMRRPEAFDAIVLGFLAEVL